MSFIPLCAWSWAYLLTPLRLLATSWTVAHQAPLSKEFFRQEYCSGSLWPPPGDLPEPEIQPASPVSPALQADSLTAEPFVPFSSVLFSCSVVSDSFIHHIIRLYSVLILFFQFPDGLRGKESACNAGDTGDAGLIPGSGRSAGGGNGNPFQYSCLKSPMYREFWWATVQRVQKSWTQLRV